MTETSKLPRGLPGILLVALGVRLFLMSLGVSFPERFVTPDGVQYLALARDLGQGYLEPASNTFPLGLSRTPVYPVFAAFWLTIGQDQVAVAILAQVLLGAMVVAGTFFVTRRVLGPREAKVAALIVALDPASVLYCLFFQPETLFTLLVLCGAWFWLAALDARRQQTAALVGVLLGLAVLARPIGLFLPVAFAAVALLRTPRPSVPFLAAAFLPFCLVVSAWITRNAVHTGAPVLSTIEGVNLLYYRAADALAIDRKISLDTARAQLEKEVQRDPAAQGNPGRRSQAERSLALRVLAEHKMAALQSAGRGVLSLMAGTGFTALSNLRGDPQPTRLDSTEEMVGAGVFASLLGLWYLAGIAGAVDLVKSGRHSALLFFVILGGYFVLMSAGPEANTRFRVPAMPFLAAIAGRGFVWAADRWRPPLVRVPPPSETMRPTQSRRRSRPRTDRAAPPLLPGRPPR